MEKNYRFVHLFLVAIFAVSWSAAYKAQSAKQLRLQVVEKDAGTQHVILMPFRQH